MRSSTIIFQIDGIGRLEGPEDRAGDDALEQPVLGDMVHALDAIHVAGGDRVQAPPGRADGPSASKSSPSA